MALVSVDTIQNFIFIIQVHNKIYYGNIIQFDAVDIGQINVRDVNLNPNNTFIVRSIRIVFKLGLYLDSETIDMILSLYEYPDLIAIRIENSINIGFTHKPDISSFNKLKHRLNHMRDEIIQYLQLDMTYTILENDIHILYPIGG